MYAPAQNDAADGTFRVIANQSADWCGNPHFSPYYEALLPVPAGAFLSCSHKKGSKEWGRGQLVLPHEMRSPCTPQPIGRKCSMHFSLSWGATSMAKSAVLGQTETGGFLYKERGGRDDRPVFCIMHFTFLSRPGRLFAPARRMPALRRCRTERSGRFPSRMPGRRSPETCLRSVPPAEWWCRPY